MRSTSRDAAVGALFALGLTILAIGVMAVGENSSVFKSKASYIVELPNVDGLVPGSPVKIAGVQVGTVEDIRLPRNPRGELIVVRLGVDRRYQDRVREDSRAALRILQLLTGEKFVEILTGSPESPPLPDGARIARLQDAEILEQVTAATENLNDISVLAKNLLESLERGEGLIGRMMTDPEFGREGIQALLDTFENLRVLSADVRDGRGFAGRVLYDEAFADRVDDLGASITKLREVMDSVKLDEGAIGALLEDDGPAEQAIEDMAVASASLRRMVEDLESDRGLLGRLLNDSEYSEAMADDLQATLSNLREITDKINRGEGTLGALVNERTLHEGMEDVVAGVNDSKFARWLLRRYRKKGIRAEEQERNSDEAAP